MISQRFLVAENLNEYFTLVFTREETGSLSLPDSKFKVVESCLKICFKMSLTHTSKGFVKRFVF